MKFGKQLALVSLVLASAVPASAQFRSGGISPSLQLISIPEVRKELKLTDAQNSQLLGVQGTVKTDMLKMFQSLKTVAPKDRADKFNSFRSELDRKLVLILDADQRKRLHELQLQREGTRALLKPDVSAELRLTAPQKEKLSAASRQESQSIRDLYKEFPKETTPEQVQLAHQRIAALQLRADNEMYEVLTDAQKKQFKTMQGAPFKFPERKAAPITISTNKPGVKK